MGKFVITNVNDARPKNRENKPNFFFPFFLLLYERKNPCAKMY
jgi:hypothetical protein